MSEPNPISVLNLVATTIGLLTLLFGVLIVMAWRYDLLFYKTLGLGDITVKANTGAFLMFSGMFLILNWLPWRGFRIVAGIMSFIAFLIGFSTIVQYLFSIDLGIDDVLFRDAFLSGHYEGPVRPSINASLTQCLLGLTLFFLVFEKVKFNLYLQFAVVFSISIHLLNLIGYFSGLSDFGYLNEYFEMSVYTSILFLPFGFLIYYLYLSKFSDKNSVELKFFGGQIFAITLVVFVTLLFNSVLIAQREVNAQFKEVQVSVEKLRQLESEVLDAELRMSHFLLNPLDSEWKSLEDVINQWRQFLDETSLIVGDDESQQLKLHTIEKLIGLRIAFADSLKSIVDFKGREAGVEFLLAYNSRTQIDQLKDLFSEFETVEMEKYTVMLEDEIQNSKLIWRLLSLNLILHVGLITGVFFLIFKNNQRMKDVMNQISNLNNDLERKVDERTALLSKSEERFRSIFENLAEGCQLIDRDWRYLFINDVAEIHNRCPKESLIGKVYMDMWPGVESTVIFSKLKTCMEERIPQKSINEFVFPDGYQGFFDIRIQPFSEGIIILSTDITKRVRAEELEKLTTEVLSHINLISETEVLIPRIIESIKARTRCELVAVRIKESFDLTSMKSFGLEYKYGGDQLKEINADCKLLDHGSSGFSPECLCRSIMGQKADFTKPYFTQEGSFWTPSSSELRVKEGGFLKLEHIKCYALKYETIVIIPLKSGDQIIGLLQLLDSRKNVFTHEDVLYLEGLCASIGIALMRNMAEKELLTLNENLEKRVVERTNKLLESNQELESFAYSVSHDLRAPLRHVIGFSEKLEKYLAENSDAEVKRLVAKISGSASKMGNLIDELLTYSRLGKTSLNLQPISLNAIIDDVIDEATYATEIRKIEWRIMQLPDVVADRTGMKLIFQNLISNALKFSGKKEETLIEIGVQEENADDFLFFIRDNGVGFNMEYSANLFGVFQRLHSQSEFEGTGIGLASVRRIITRHGGKVWAEAKEDEGATFYFTLPKHVDLNLC